ncbi:MAG: UDP-N-acetylmuramoyl-L-alanyl-D-glutamate--2,6-diaminopimelate ligase [Deltaproteobacteria bacterium]|nr:UDP-N-acetylmuramoyl-L-alanyl-D-glutamate--2,6-diaminopimelate ligase [Deltaproteobacteria bacterium]
MTAPSSSAAPTARAPRVLAELLAGWPIAEVSGALGVVVDHFAQDSRELGPGGLFVATRGTHWDGHAFIAAALAQGVSAVVAEAPAPADLRVGVTWVRVAEGTSMAALAHIAAVWYGHPGRDVRVLATTGTNGKTTTTFLLHHIFTRVGLAIGLVSTVETRIGERRGATIFTTPPAPELQALLAAMRSAGCRFAAIEASSHGLHQRRIAAFRVAVAGFSNLTRDHLDYHGTMEAYEAAKRVLFDELADRACFNVDDPVGARFAAGFTGPKLTFSARGAAADLSVADATFDLAGTRATIRIAPAARDTLGLGDSLSLSIPLIGSHNLQNALLALGMATLAGLDGRAGVEALATATGAPGRLQRVAATTLPGGAGPEVFVDYAHSPDALDNVLVALRDVMGSTRPDGARPALVVVFGAGGDRDRGKRPQMAAVAARLADRVVVTSDNPRTEDPEVILDDIVAGLPAGFAFVREVDRRRAIARAIAEAADGDVVLVAGKGHEDYQIIGTTKHPFDDVAVAREALSARQTAEATR